MVAGHVRASLRAAPLVLFVFCSVVQAQSPASLDPGVAAVTRFSGTAPSVPGANTADKLAIDLGGPSLRTIDLRSMGAPPQGQVVAPAKPPARAAARVRSGKSTPAAAR